MMQKKQPAADEIPAARSYLKRIGRRWALIIGVTATIKLLHVAGVRLTADSLLSGKAERDLLERRAYLVTKVLDDDDATGIFAGTLPPQFTGEWKIATWSMTAAAVTNLAYLSPRTRADAVVQLDRVVGKLLEKEAREFDTLRWGEDALETLDGGNGHIGYLGHLLFVLGAKRLAGGDDDHDKLMRAVASALARRIMASPTRLLETYPGETYLPDNVVVTAALRVVDRALGTQTRAVDEWVAAVRDRFLDRETGLIVFSTLSDGTVTQGPRGSGAGWNSFYLPFIDAGLAREQAERAIVHLYDEPLFGLIAGLREHPRGRQGSGDIDSGPVILGLSTSGTGFFVAGLRQLRDRERLDRVLRTAELAGTTVSFGGNRRYLAAPLVGDAIMLAMLTSTEWEGGPRRY